MPLSLSDGLFRRCLLKLMIALLKPDGGHVGIGNQDISRLGRSEVHHVSGHSPARRLAAVIGAADVQFAHLGLQSRAL